jgi:hypothetical protein
MVNFNRNVNLAMKPVLNFTHKELLNNYAIFIATRGPRATSLTWVILANSCRTVALWFYILVSDHNATDPVMQKSCNLRRRFFCALWGLISPFSCFLKIKYLLFPNSRHILVPVYILSNSIYLYKPIHLLVSNSLQLGKHGFRMAV